MRPSPSADPHGCVQNGRLPTFVTKPRNSLRRSHVQHRIPCLWYFQSAPLAKPETSCTIQVSRERHALEKTKKTGGNSSVGRVPDCDSGCRGFESHFPPQILEPLQANARRGFFVFPSFALTVPPAAAPFGRPSSVPALMCHPSCATPHVLLFGIAAEVARKRRFAASACSRSDAHRQTHTIHPKALP